MSFEFTDGLAIAAALGGLYYLKKMKPASQKSKEQLFDLYQVEKMYDDGFMVTEDHRFVYVLQVSPILFELKSLNEQRILWDTIRRISMTLPHPFRFRVESHPYNLSDYFEELKGKTIASGVPQDIQFVEELRDTYSTILESEEVQDTLGYLILETDSRFLSDGGLESSNMVFQTVLNKAQQLNADNEEVARQELQNSIKVVQTMLSSVGIWTRLLDRTGINAMLYKSGNREMASIIPFEQMFEQMKEDDGTKQSIGKLQYLPSGSMKGKSRMQDRRQQKESENDRKKHSKRMRKKPKENTPNLSGFSNAELDAIAPVMFKEKIPSNGINDYWLEIGDNVQSAKYIKTYFLEFKGRNTWLGMLDPILLAKGDGQIDITILFEPQEPDYKSMQIASRMAVIEADIDKEVKADKISKMRREYHDLNAQLERLQTNIEKPFLVLPSVSIQASTPDKLRRVCRVLQKRMASAGIRFLASDTRQLDAWRHSIGLGSKQEFLKLGTEMESCNVADLFPFIHGGLLDRKGMLIGLDHLNRPVFMDAWNQRVGNRNQLIFGQSGYGKSQSMKNMIRRSKIEGVRIGIIDVDGEFKHLVNAVGGKYIELSTKGRDQRDFERINLYDVEDEVDELGQHWVNLEETCEGVQSILFEMIRLFEPADLTGQVKVAIMDSLRGLYKKFEITEDPKSLYIETENGRKRKTPPTLSDHYSFMKEHYPQLESVLDYIKVFTKKGGDPAKSIFDGQSTFSITDSEVVAISIAGLDKEFMRRLGHLVAQRMFWEKFIKKNPTIKKRLVHDEAQEAMQYPEEAKWLENAYRRIRKLNGAMTIITQGFEVLLRVPEGLGILKNSPTILLMRQEALDIEAVAGKFSLSEGEANFLLQVPIGCGILRVDKESTIVQFTGTPEEDILYSTDINELLRLQQEAVGA